MRTILSLPYNIYQTRKLLTAVCLLDTTLQRVKMTLCGISYLVKIILIYLTLYSMYKKTARNWGKSSNWEFLVLSRVGVHTPRSHTSSQDSGRVGSGSVDNGGENGVWIQHRTEHEFNNGIGYEELVSKCCENGMKFKLYSRDITSIQYSSWLAVPFCWTG